MAVSRGCVIIPTQSSLAETFEADLLLLQPTLLNTLIDVFDASYLNNLFDIQSAFNEGCIKKTTAELDICIFS